MKKLTLVLDQTNWLEATWIEEITAEVQVEKEGEIVTEEKTETKIIHCESYSGHLEHISMLRARALEFETPLDEYEDLIQKAKAGFVMPSQEELDLIKAEQERLEAKAKRDQVMLEGAVYVLDEIEYKISFTKNDGDGLVQVKSAFELGLTETVIKFENGTLLPIKVENFLAFAYWFVNKRNSFFIGV